MFLWRLKVLNDSRAEFERWFKSRYHIGNQPSGRRRDYSLAKDSKGQYLWLRAAVAWRAWRAARGES